MSTPREQTDGQVDGPIEEQPPATPVAGSRAVQDADLADKYHTMTRLADLFDDAGDQMRARARLGTEVLTDEAVVESAALCPTTHARAEEDIRAATTGKHGLISRSIELDADALVIRATVLTYRWIDELQNAASRTLGAIAGRAIGYLAPEVALGGAIVSAGLIETDALDRDGVAAYLSELAAANPALMDHVSSGGGGLVDVLQMRSLLTAGFPTGPAAGAATRGGMRAMGVLPFAADAGSALRDIAGALVEPDAVVPSEAGPDTVEETVGTRRLPHTLADLMTALSGAPRSITVQRTAAGRYIAYLPGPDGGTQRRLRLVGGDQGAYAAQVVAAIERAVAGEPDAHVMLVGSGAGGVTAAEIAATLTSDAFVIDQVVTAGAPQAHVPRIPERTRVLSLEDRTDPVALLGSLVSAGAANRTTVVFDGGGATGGKAYILGGQAADRAAHPDLRQEIGRIHQLGFLTGDTDPLADEVTA